MAVTGQNIYVDTNRTTYPATLLRGRVHPTRECVTNGLARDRTVNYHRVLEKRTPYDRLSDAELVNEAQGYSIQTIAITTHH